MGAFLISKEAKKMDRQVLLRKIMSVGDETRRLQQDLIALQSVDVVNYPENYSNLSHDAAIRSEFITHKLRGLVYGTTNIPKTEYLEGVADSMEIRVNCGIDGIIEITVPCLLPHRRKKQAEIITAPLNAALERFIASYPKDSPFRRFKHCVICIAHVYDKTLYGKGRKRDHDNIETKAILDSINTFLLTDDNESLCDFYTASEISDQDITRIFVMKKDIFPEWVLRYKLG
jgi:hypothetical protein